MGMVVGCLLSVVGRIRNPDTILFKQGFSRHLLSTY